MRLVDISVIRVADVKLCRHVSFICLLTYMVPSKFTSSSNEFMRCEDTSVIRVADVKLFWVTRREAVLYFRTDSVTLIISVTLLKLSCDAGRCGTLKNLVKLQIYHLVK